ncbi:dynamin family protein [Nocardia sp. NBC_01327]|uniref:dynamin family protein n=1 Tax=Nocardia sp. NBC_01327 TaxID=2903593 RepID=UPI002E0EAF84|nr:dynamin family protein [Nocardia sp. NBC_01327]
MTASTPASARKLSPSTDSMTALLDELRSVTDAVGRTDLSNRLVSARQRVSDARLRIVVTGQSKKGISSLVNALVAADVCSTNAAAPERTRGPRPVAGPVIVEYGESKSKKVGEAGRTEVTLPVDLLAEGVVLIDMPGVTGAGSRRATEILSMLPTVDAVLFVSDASQEYTAPEIRFLQQIHQLCPMVAGVINKIDSYVRWADIQKANRKHLTDADLDLPILPVSSAMHKTAHRLGDQMLEVESGIPQLEAFIRNHLVARADALARESVVNDVRVVSDHVALALNSELTALQDPSRSAELLDRIRTARDTAEALRKRTANWQYVLGDGITELTVSVEHDLRHRLRAIVREAEEEIMKSDPARQWEAFGERINGRVSAAVEDNFILAHQLSIDLAGKVADRFSEDGKVQLPALPGADTDALLGQLGSVEALESGKAGVVQRAITSLRGSYGGVLMVGLATSLLGLALVNPWSIGAGLLLGANTFREDHKALKARRRSEARLAVARLMDEVVFQVSKESKQRLRDVQRTLRDHFTTVADEMLRSANDSLQAAQEAGNTHESERAARIAQVQGNLGHLRQLRVQAAGLVQAGEAQ